MLHFHSQRPKSAIICNFNFTKKKLMNFVGSPSNFDKIGNPSWEAQNS